MADGPEKVLPDMRPSARPHLKAVSFWPFFQSHMLDLAYSHKFQKIASWFGAQMECSLGRVLKAYALNFQNGVQSPRSGSAINTDQTEFNRDGPEDYHARTKSRSTVRGIGQPIQFCCLSQGIAIISTYNI
jgi:hypothetical protein